jgi:YbbR domain-containing protein
VTRALTFLLRNWPLKLAAILLATLLYSGLVLSQDSRTAPVTVPIDPDNQPPDTVLIWNNDQIQQIRYFVAGTTLVPVNSTSFRATLDLSGVRPGAGPVFARVDVEPLDQRITVLSFDPPAVRVELVPVVSDDVPVRVVPGNVPAGLEIRTPVADLATVQVRGPKTEVDRVVEVQARVQIDDSGISIDQQVELIPVDAAEERVPNVSVEPNTVGVRIDVFTDRRTRTVPVHVVVTGQPAPGFAVGEVSVDPQLVTLEGDASELAGSSTADTEPIVVNGLDADLVQEVALVLPAGVRALDLATVTVTVRIRPVTDTRTLGAGIELIGAAADRTYSLSTGRVLATIAGPPGELDALAAGPIVLSLDVTGLGPGQYQLVPIDTLPGGLTLVTTSPPTVEVTIAAASTSAAPGASAPASP